MAVVPAFTSIVGTDQAGMTAYYRAPGCNSVTIADILPILSKINHYEPEYVIGEMLIWDTGSQSVEPNNCTMVRVIVYNDGWICAWFDKTTTNQISIGGAQFIDSQTLEGWGSTLEYEDKWNSAQLKIIDSTDPDCPPDTVFTIRNTDHVNGRIQVHTNNATGFSFHSGYTYSANIYMCNGNIMWWGVNPCGYNTAPPENSNTLYRALYQVWIHVKNSSNSTNWSPIDATLVYRYDSQLDTYSDETIVFNNSGLDDCQVLPFNEVVNDAFYISYSDKFNGVTLTINTPGVGSGVTWEYWDGSTWTALSCVDGSTGFTATGELTFNPPDSWSNVVVNGGDYYWVRARVTTASYTTTPILTQGRLYSQDDIDYFETELGMYNFEFTGANYLLLCGDYIVYNVARYFYYTVLPGKIIYSADFNIGQYESSSPYYEQSYINGVYVHRCEHTTDYGYLNFNLTDIDYSPGIQNCCAISEESYTYGHGRMAVVLLVS